MTDSQVRSKRRITDHGEVFTGEREVKAMCDLVKQETERIESRFLEPACGNGNFLAEVLNRKLAVVKARYGRSPADYERYAIVALSSLYGVELLEDNAQECRERLFSIWNEAYTAAVKKYANDQCREAARFIMKKNILCGDALTMRQADGSPIVFAEWSLVMGTMVKRRDFELAALLNQRKPPEDPQQMSLDTAGWEYDEETQAFLPAPIREYPLTNYRRVQDYE